MLDPLACGACMLRLCHLPVPGAWGSDIDIDCAVDEFPIEGAAQGARSEPGVQRFRVQGCGLERPRMAQSSFYRPSRSCERCLF